MFRDHLRTGVQHVGLALRDPEAFAVAWNDGQGAYQWPVWAALLATAIVGTTTYGMTMGLIGWRGRHRLQRLHLHAGGRPRLGNPAAGAVHPQQPFRLAAAGQQHAVGGARDRELGRAGDDRVDPDQLVFHGHCAASDVCADRESDCIHRRRASR